MTQIRLTALGPFHHRAALAMLTAHAIPGAEEVKGAIYRRVLAVDDAHVPVRLALDERGVLADLGPTTADLDVLVSRIRGWFDLDRDIRIIDHTFTADPIIGPLVDKRPGLRLIGYPDEFEAVAATVIGQQVSLATARTFAGRLVAAFGVPVPSSELCVFPEARTIAQLTIDEIRSRVGLTGARAKTLHEVAVLWADGPRLTGLTVEEARRLLLAIPGIGPWTADYLQVRALQHPDTFAPGDLVARRALGLDQHLAKDRSRAWAPHRTHALLHLWTEAAYL
ncbi:MULTISPECIES: AlkA N-terminal domain-containing protein [Arthrobacter]|uniref:DNA-3-methyladenine glycosylase II n=2 Tax=Arthrobacter TaxID=1663 RepID=A0ABU9KPV9_9MICC|nr:AlkA N-terminal domain-containing protein [Arthrobacter sp. YJM1]MDP5228600.1 AlkA N-terminal domain-containing protein [Arthrobacter sp. YJM1]